MRIGRIQIQNYRSVEKKIDLAPGEIAALVGPNNAGKTNILAALNFLLGDRYPMITGLDDLDFYGKARENGLLIKVWFERNKKRIDAAWFEYDSARQQGSARCRYENSPKDYNLTNDTTTFSPGLPRCSPELRSTIQQFPLVPVRASHPTT